jgi:hypothetical protein
MAEQTEAHGFLDAATTAFLARRLHNRRLRAGAVRGLKGDSANAVADLQPDVDHAADCLAGIPSVTAAAVQVPLHMISPCRGAPPAPTRIGFGSVKVENPAAITRTIFTALEKASARGIVSEGWAHLSGERLPPNVFLIGDCPHD